MTLWNAISKTWILENSRTSSCKPVVLSREYIESQAASKAVTERYLCPSLLKPMGGDDARMSYELDDGD